MKNSRSIGGYGSFRPFFDFIEKRFGVRIQLVDESFSTRTHVVLEPDGSSGDAHLLTNVYSLLPQGRERRFEAKDYSNLALSRAPKFVNGFVRG